VAKEPPSPDLDSPAPVLVSRSFLALGAAEWAGSSRVCAFDLEEVAYASLAKDVVASRLASIGNRDRRGPHDQWHRSAGDRWHSQRSASRRGPGRGGPLAEADEDVEDMA
jgi:hypothetical protein